MLSLGLSAANTVKANVKIPRLADTLACDIGGLEISKESAISALGEVK